MPESSCECADLVRYLQCWLGFVKGPRACYDAFAGKSFRTAADPGHSVSPVAATAHAPQAPNLNAYTHINVVQGTQECGRIQCCGAVCNVPETNVYNGGYQLMPEPIDPQATSIDDPNYR